MVCKHIHSIHIQIEGLLEDVDFKAHVSRKEFEDLCSDLFERIEDPVTQALEAADMTMVSNYQFHLLPS